jgi:sugar phosphate isomerase/epimerase
MMDLKSQAHYKISLAHLTALGYPPPDLTYLAHRTGFDYVSFRIMHLDLSGEPNYELARNPVMLRETKAALCSTGMRVLDVELARIKDGVDVRSYLPALETASELNARNVISSIWTSDRAYATEALTELCEIAGKLGIFVNLEFVTWSNLPNLQSAKEIIRAVNHPNLALLVDTIHFYRSGIRLNELDTIPKSWFRMLHLCDAPAEIPESKTELTRTGREARLDPGEGKIDLAQILDRIPEVPYSLEVPNLERVARIGYEEHVRLVSTHTRNYLACHPRRGRQVAV